MSKQEEASGPLTFTELGVDIPPYPQRFLDSSPSYRCHEPMDSQTTYGCHSPQPLFESETYAPPTTYGCHSPQLLFEYSPQPCSPQPLACSPRSCSPPPYLSPAYSGRRSCSPPAYSPPAYSSPAYLPPEPGRRSCSPPAYPPLAYSSPAYLPPEPERRSCSPPAYSPPGYSSPEPGRRSCSPVYSPLAYSPQEPGSYATFEPTFETAYDFGLFLKKSPMKSYGLPGLIGQIGLHCYNLHKGTNLKFVGVAGYFPKGIFSSDVLLVAEDPISNSIFNFETEVCYVIGMEGSMKLNVTNCILKPEVDCRSEKLPKDDLFEDSMPNCMHEVVLTGSDELQYYEMKGSEMQEEKEWLHLYAELAMFAKLNYSHFFKDEPETLELRKIIVQTRQDVESKKVAKARNAIFYISFKSKGGQDYNAIIRRTTVKTPNHMSLEVKCLM